MCAHSSQNRELETNVLLLYEPRGYYNLSFLPLVLKEFIIVYLDFHDEVDRAKLK